MSNAICLAKIAKSCAGMKPGTCDVLSAVCHSKYLLMYLFAIGRGLGAVEHTIVTYHAGYP